VGEKKQSRVVLSGGALDGQDRKEIATKELC